MTPRLAAPGTTALLGMVAVWLVLGVGRLAAHDRPNGPLHKTALGRHGPARDGGDQPAPGDRRRHPRPAGRRERRRCGD